MPAPANIVTRFAPSPTGRLHVGHAYSALFAARAAQGGRFLLRIEDIDLGRCRLEFEEGIYEDLAWLGLEWATPVRRQSDHFDDYRAALRKLDENGLIYPCFCTRKDIQREVERANQAPHGPDGVLYPGTCRALSADERMTLIAAGEAHALRLDMAKAVEAAGPLAFEDRERGRMEVDGPSCGDVVLARKDVPTSYHLAVTVDDAIQGVTLVTRGEDLLHATHIHRILQALLGLPAPEYWHHGLLTGADGKRFAKRDRSLTLQALREAGRSPAEVRAMAGFAE
ncbi:MAG: tRNA glutamyl-Q(34) synthetase GluQRS [Alphaproteobacteria bacterium]|nr:tRNA glutamyl-Q(34) synthetase GluQRS [Alphaproteobacteria bacterium]